ncbi:MAG: Crp/Fnr family transcriptional regulator [Bacteroidetes bacterium]|nr:Crp/Fnr family transcriptional regulator [Bacteroidota bacterium]
MQNQIDKSDEFETNSDNTLDKRLSYLGSDLLKEISDTAHVKTFGANVELIREGQYVKVVPIVLSGLIKVYTRFEDKELLLYYIQPDQSCIMSFSSAIHHDKSKIIAVTQQESTVLLLPTDMVNKWVHTYPAINTLFYNQYDLRYAELIDTINHLIYDKLDKRVLNYLREKIKITQHNPIKIMHKEIACDLGTSREVVSRLLKKLENEKLLKQHHDSIEIFS